MVPRGFSPKSSIPVLRPDIEQGAHDGFRTIQERSGKQQSKAEFVLHTRIGCNLRQSCVPRRIH